MILAGDRWHRWLLAAVLGVQAVAFAGVDPPVQALTAALVLALAVDLRHAMPPVPRAFRWAALLLGGVTALQLVPLPAAVRGVLQPGLREVTPAGWYTLSVAPWATLETAAAWAVALGLALTAARLASTRSGLPFLLWTLAGTGGVLALLGLATEAGLPAKVLLVRENTGGGSPYGPFVNENHFAVAMELTIPAAVALLGAALRNLGAVGAARRRAVASALASGTIAVLGVAALIRCHSRGGLVAMGAAAVLVAAWWRGPRPRRRWVWPAAAVLLLAGAGSLAWTRLPAVVADFQELLVIQGIEGNDRWDLWAATLRLWRRAPLTGTGLGTYRHVIGLDAPPTGTAVLEHAHNDWLELAAGAGVPGAAALLLAVGWLAVALRPGRVRRFRYERRYPLAAAATALTAAALHETIGFALQIPLDRSLAALWVGLVWAAALRWREHGAGGPGGEAG